MEQCKEESSTSCVPYMHTVLRLFPRGVTMHDKGRFVCPLCRLSSVTLRARVRFVNPSCSKACALILYVGYSLLATLPSQFQFVVVYYISSTDMYAHKSCTSYMNNCRVVLNIHISNFKIPIKLPADCST